MKHTKIALCQISPGPDRNKNVRRAYEMVDEAVGNHVDLIIFPELFYTPYDLSAIKKCVGYENEILNGFCTLARSNSVSICTGSMAWSEGEKHKNRSHLISNDGSILLQYDKCHLFDVRLDTVQLTESAVFSAGDRVQTADAPFGRTGVLICYDIRFPEMAREITLLGAELLLVPAVFNQVTGKAHWHHFMKTRATENQIYLVAVSTGADNAIKGSYRPYGHSMVVSPWGEIIAEAGEDECIVYAECDPAVLEETRRKLPLLQHRRGGLYTSFRQ